MSDCRYASSTSRSLVSNVSPSVDLAATWILVASSICFWVPVMELSSKSRSGSRNESHWPRVGSGGALASSSARAAVPPIRPVAARAAARQPSTSIRVRIRGPPSVELQRFDRSVASHMPDAYLLKSYTIASRGSGACPIGGHPRPKLWLASYRPTRDQDPPAERQDALALLVDGSGLDVDHPAVALGRGRRHLQDLRLGVDRVAVEGGAEVHHLLVHQVGERVLADVPHAHADREREHERAVHQAAAVLALAREVLVQVERVRVHGEEREPGVVEVADGAAGPVLDHLPHAEILEVGSHAAGLSGFAPAPSSWRAAAAVCYRRPMPTHKPPQRRRAGARTARAVKSAAARAVERVLSSADAFALLIRRLEAAGWRVERDASAASRTAEGPPAPAPSARER